MWALTTHNTRCDPAALLIEANLDELGVSVAEAAKGMKVTRQQLYNVMRGRSAASPDMALRLEQALGGSASMWMGMQSAYELVQARKEQVKLTIRCLGEWRVTMPAHHLMRCATRRTRHTESDSYSMPCPQRLFTPAHQPIQPSYRSVPREASISSARLRP